MAPSHLLVRLLDDGDCRRTVHFSRIATSSDDDVWPTTENPLYPPRPEKEVEECVASCNGLLCLEYTDGKYLLWNPSTNESKSLPCLEHDRYPPCTWCHNPPCAPRVLNLLLVDWVSIRNLTSNDYKFLRVFKICYENFEFFYPHGGHPHGVFDRVVVYSLNDDSWKDIGFGGVRYDFDHDCAATYLEGCCYWRGYDCVISFDLANGKFSALPFPDIGKGDLWTDYKLHLIEAHDGGGGSSLGAVVYPVRQILKLFRFYAMEEGSRWTRKINLDVWSSRIARPLGFCRNDESFLFQGRDGELLRFSYAKQQLKKIDKIFPTVMLLFPELNKRRKSRKDRRKVVVERRRRRHRDYYCYDDGGEEDDWDLESRRNRDHRMSGIRRLRSVVVGGKERRQGIEERDTHDEKRQTRSSVV